tara:strand:+ start:132 stop:971 length:840 start_codon:yes stop_codon:yes gene_type:complete
MSKINSIFNWVCIIVSVYLIYWGASAQVKITQAINNATKNGSSSHDFIDDNGTSYSPSEMLILRIISIIAMIFGASTFLSSNGAFAIELDNWTSFSTLQYPTGIKAIFGVLLILIMFIIFLVSQSHNDKQESTLSCIFAAITLLATVFQWFYGDTVYKQDKDTTKAFEELAETHGLTRRQRSELNSCLSKQSKLKEKLDKKAEGIDTISKGFLSVGGKQDVVDTGKSNKDLIEENKQLTAALQQTSKKLDQMEQDDDETGDDDEFDLDGEEFGFDDEED